MRTKKEYELLHLNQFKIAYDEFPEGVINDSESPDFIIDNGDSKIGIEVTKIYKSSSDSPPLQAIESICKKVADSACNICNERGIPPLIIYLHFIRKPQIINVHRDELSNKIADYVCNNIPQPENFLTLKNRYNDPTYPEYIHAITIGRLNVLTKHHFSVPSVGRVQSNFSAELQKAINSKNIKISTYNDTCIEQWLLIVAEGLDPSTFFESSGNTKNDVFKSDFNRTFFIESFSGFYWELQTN